jgi:hypothetical protein
MMLSAIGRCMAWLSWAAADPAWALRAISLALEAVLTRQKTTQCRWRLGGHQRDAPRQGDHPKDRPGAEAELRADSLGNHDLELGGDGRDIQGNIVIRNTVSASTPAGR